MFCALFDLVKQLTGLFVQFQHIHKAGWNCIIADLDYAQAKGLRFVLNEMDGTKTESEDIINKLFNNIQMADESTSGLRRKLDQERFTAINIHQKYSIPNRGRDKGLIAQNVQSNKSKAHMQAKKSNMTKSVPVKRKQNRQSNNNKKKSKKTIVIDSDIEEDYLALKERELALREREAKICVMELSNSEKERQLNLADYSRLQNCKTTL
ncbi:hypothetical protein RhiirA4_454843 [Rhizophagus irregularis]|uniref:Uncharacterized protein n=1 Tax=Rhizophagus irregularis TaxID=588596 RepID=A0A2I1G3T6_9GLOM|nr:hypothetical protein RhiirA4_454843 [Rhizophagus irregularis]